MPKPFVYSALSVFWRIWRDASSLELRVSSSIQRLASLNGTDTQLIAD
jgi:hypothetical protein